MDSSKSMAKDAGDGRSRMDVTKEAVRKLVDGLPSSARLGVRAYGSRVSESTRRAGCRDTRQLVPVGPLASGGIADAVDALEPTGRTPIGRSLRLAPKDFPAGAEKRTVVLLSDGGDNCAPPDPCKVAEQVAQQGVELSIQVVGLQVASSARRQLRCIAEAGGGSYVDADDADELLEELRAALARAFRSYEPTGKPVSGGVDPASAPTIAPGEYLDTIRPGETRHYAVELPEGRRLWFSATLVGEPGSNRGIAKTPFRLRFLNPDGETTRERFELYGTRDRKVDSIADWGAPVGTDDFWARPGRYVAAVTLDARGIDAGDYPLELAARVLGPAEAPGDRFASAPAP
ncbi:MAG TPA: VWA domain-containing protein, partial [Solirubrobacteraceae bacterium]|nr:VWA domain-containing protein [Solirubrobacteraceae bacterium]